MLHLFQKKYPANFLYLTVLDRNKRYITSILYYRLWCFRCKLWFVPIWSSLFVLVVIFSIINYSFALNICYSYVIYEWCCVPYNNIFIFYCSSNFELPMFLLLSSSFLSSSFFFLSFFLSFFFFFFFFLNSLTTLFTIHLYWEGYVYFLVEIISYIGNIYSFI